MTLTDAPTATDAAGRHRSSGISNTRGTQPTPRPTARPSSPPTPTSSTSAGCTTSAGPPSPRGHQQIFDTIYAGSTGPLSNSIGPARSDGCIVAVVGATLDAPHGPLQGINHARFTLHHRRAPTRDG